MRCERCERYERYMSGMSGGAVVVRRGCGGIQTGGERFEPPRASPSSEQWVKHEAGGPLYIPLVCDAIWPSVTVLVEKGLERTIGPAPPGFSKKDVTGSESERVPRSCQLGRQ